MQFDREARRPGGDIVLALPQAAVAQGVHRHDEFGFALAITEGPGEQFDRAPPRRRPPLDMAGQYLPAIRQRLERDHFPVGPDRLHHVEQMPPEMGADINGGGSALQDYLVNALDSTFETHANAR